MTYLWHECSQILANNDKET